MVQVLEFDRLAKREVNEIRAGDVCAVVGLDEAEIGDTICDLIRAVALPPLTIDEPTLDMYSGQRLPIRRARKASR